MTARLTAPLDVAALIFEVAGIVIGLAPEPICLLWLAPSVSPMMRPTQRLLGKGFEQVINSIERSLHARPDSEIERPESSAQTEHGASMQPSPGRDAERGNGLTRPGRGRTRRERAGERREPGSRMLPDGRTMSRRERADEDGARHLR